MFGAIKDS